MRVRRNHRLRCCLSSRRVKTFCASNICFHPVFAWATRRSHTRFASGRSAISVRVLTLPPSTPSELLYAVCASASVELSETAPRFRSESGHFVKRGWSSRWGWLYAPVSDSYRQFTVYIGNIEYGLMHYSYSCQNGPAVF